MKSGLRLFRNILNFPWWFSKLNHISPRETMKTHRNFYVFSLFLERCYYSTLMIVREKYRIFLLVNKRRTLFRGSTLFLNIVKWIGWIWFTVISGQTLIFTPFKHIVKDVEFFLKKYLIIWIYFSKNDIFQKIKEK